MHITATLMKEVQHTARALMSRYVDTVASSRWAAHTGEMITVTTVPRVSEPDTLSVKVDGREVAHEHLTYDQVAAVANAMPGLAKALVTNFENAHPHYTRLMEELRKLREEI